MLATASTLPPPRYLFVIGDLDSSFVTHDDPTPEDRAHARSGTALIVRLTDWHYLGRAGRWRPLDLGILGTVELDDKTTPPFHALREHFDGPGSKPLHPA